MAAHLFLFNLLITLEKHYSHMARMQEWDLVSVAKLEKGNIHWNICTFQKAAITLLFSGVQVIFLVNNGVCFCLSAFFTLKKWKLAKCLGFIPEESSLSAMAFMQPSDVSFLPVGELPLCLVAFPVWGLGVEVVAPLLNFRVPWEWSQPALK